MGWTGLRTGEASALRVKNLELDEHRRRGKVRVVEAISVVSHPHLGPTKTGQNRVVTLPGFLVAEMVKHLEQFEPLEGLVCGGPKGGFLDRHNFYNRVWRPALRVADLEEPQPRVHDLRHTAVSLGIKAGAHLKEIQARAGHSSIRITMDRYGHLFPGQDEALAERLDTLRPEGGFGIFSAQKQTKGKVVPLRQASDQGK